jgi:predicted dithiol-disulfide oxidoreductase (DUF899 family)
MPWVRVEKNYVFKGPNGPQTLADLFEGRSQLLVKHFMFAPGWKGGCVGFSLDVDHIEGALVRLEYHDVTFTKDEIARGEAYHNSKMQVVEIEEMPGISVFYKNTSGDVFHTYSTYGRGAEELVSAYVCLDLTPKGRNETGPGFNLGDWVRHHDRYDDDATS